MDKEGYITGRGAQINTKNKFLEQEYTTEIEEAVDEPWYLDKPGTQIFYETPKTIVNKVESPDVGMEYSLNPYQGCEHGCAYCYARTTHEYWGYSAGIDFESKIIVKKNAPALLEKFLLKAGWKPKPIVLSGNTDCYQPLERKLKITRKLLEIFERYRHPVGIITKNAVLLRDIELLQSLAKDNLVRVMISITSLDESLRSKLEPRTASVKKKLNAIEKLSANGVPVGIMVAPIIPGLTDHEIPSVMKAAADSGARGAGYTIVRLNGAIGPIFQNWLETNFQDRASKVLNQIKQAHGGKLSDSQFGRRMRGESKITEAISQLFNNSRNKYFPEGLPPLNTAHFRRGGNYTLF